MTGVMGSVLGGFYAAGAIMPVPSTPGPGWGFELLIGTLAALLFAAAVLMPRLHTHLHLRHGGHATVHSKSL